MDIPESKTALFLWFCQCFPPHPMHLIFFILATPPVLTNHGANLITHIFLLSQSTPWQNVGIAWATALIRTSLPARDSNFSFQPCILFHILSFKYANTDDQDLPT